MSDATAVMEQQPADKVLAILQTRCGCERTLEVPSPPPKTVTIELAMFTKTEAVETRVFYLRATGTHPKVAGNVYLYIEGPQREKSRIVVPGSLPPGLIKGTIRP